MQTAPALRRRWTCPQGMEASLTHYPAAGRQARHVHDHAQVTFLLAGELSEQVERREHRPSGASVGYKPAGAAHSDEWGPRGALLFTIKLPEPCSERHVAGREPGWAAAEEETAVAGLVRMFVEAPEGQTQADALADLLSLASAEPRLQGAPPAWLARAREQLLDSAAPIEAVARQAGVHRVHLSRMFRSYYGVAPSLFRRRAMVARGVETVLRSGPALSQAALDAGFCDQAHLTRRLRLDTGFGPGALRALLATSVQSPTRRRL